MHVLVPSLVEETQLSLADDSVVEVHSDTLERPRDRDEDEVRNPRSELGAGRRRFQPRHPMIRNDFYDATSMNQVNYDVKRSGNQSISCSESRGSHDHRVKLVSYGG